jgi:asparagine synthase (glutamine-hydrolysing)
MCGIVGQIVFKTEVDISNFDAMRDTLSHRGPDGFGTQVLENGKVALGHRRLSIIDLSENGKQPMCNETGSVWITFNGEIYNFKEIRNDLLKSGHQFKSDCDTEVIVHGYEQWGTGIFSRLKGMFALGLFDCEKHKLILARDRFGIKPLYYYRDHNTFIFGSELKAIVKSALFSKQIDWSAVNDFFVYRFIPTPKSIWSGVKKLEAASYLEIDYSGNVSEPTAYWKLESFEREHSFDDVIARFDGMMTRAVEEHLLSDVPLGVFLSGGYDSSAMVYYMDQLKYPVKSFSIGFQDWAKSEHGSARMVSDIFHTDHTEKILTDEKIDAVGMLAYYYDEPQGGSSFLPTYEVSKLASEKVKVVIAGDGGDELLAGYTWHKNIIDYYNGSYLKQLKRKLTPDFLERNYHNSLSWTSLTYKETNALFNERISPKDLPDDLWLYKEKRVKGEDPLKALQRLDINTFMLDVFLPKVDRASMANSIEVRVPFLDHSLMEFIFSLPSHLYFRKNVNKVLLHQILKRKLPDQILNKSKQGFGSPLNKNREMKRIISDLSQGRLVKEKIIDQTILNKYIDAGAINKLWALYVFESWFDKWN